MKQCIVFSFIFAAALCRADEPVVTNAVSQTDREQLIARQQERYNQRTGGRIIKPGSRQGCVAFVNQQTRLPKTEIERVVELLRKDFDVTFKVVEAQPESAPDRAVKEGVATFAVVIVDEKDAPTTLVAPEECWAKVNLAKFTNGIKPGKLNYIQYNARCRKGILKAFAMVCGGYGSQFQGNMMSVLSVEDLDSVEEFIPGDVIMRQRQCLRANRVTGDVIVPYIRACRDGWAPKPTNDVQRAIWEKVRSEKERGPANPIKIEKRK